MVGPIPGLVSLTGSCPFQHNVNMGTGPERDGGDGIRYNSGAGESSYM